MKYVKISLFVSLVALVGVLFYDTARAQTNGSTILDDVHKERIAANCTSAKSSLRQLHRSDVLLRVNRGQLYDFIGSKLMARLNSRLALNKLDAGQLITIAARYDKSLNDFREAFRLYEEQISAVIKIDCQKDPEAFYYGVRDANSKRALVHRHATDLNSAIDDYYNNFNEFRKTYQKTDQEDVS